MEQANPVGNYASTHKSPCWKKSVGWLVGLVLIALYLAFIPLSVVGCRHLLCWGQSPDLLGADGDSGMVQRFSVEDNLLGTIIFMFTGFDCAETL